MIAPATAQTAATTAALARTTSWRAGTATAVARIRPLLYSPSIVDAPKLVATTISARYPASGNPSLSESSSVGGLAFAANAAEPITAAVVSGIVHRVDRNERIFSHSAAIRSRITHPRPGSRRSPR